MKTGFQVKGLSLLTIKTLYCVLSGLIKQLSGLGKNWVKKVDVSRNNSVSNIDFSYDSKKGGTAEGELYYLTTKDNKISFYYGTASAILANVKTYNKQACIILFFGKKCKNNLFTPIINEETLKDKVNLRMRNAIRFDILFKNIADAFKTVAKTVVTQKK